MEQEHFRKLQLKRSEKYVHSIVQLKRSAKQSQNVVKPKVCLLRCSPPSLHVRERWWLHRGSGTAGRIWAPPLLHPDQSSWSCRAVATSRFWGISMVFTCGVLLRPWLAVVGIRGFGLFRSRTYWHSSGQFRKCCLAVTSLIGLIELTPSRGWGPKRTFEPLVLTSVPQLWVRVSFL